MKNIQLQTIKNTQTQLAKAAILLVISLGLLWFLEDFYPVRFFESQSTGWTLWVSYANDLLLPFAFYFFLCLGERWLKTWQIRAGIAFAIPVLLELGQGFFQLFPIQRYTGAFDLLDILMYAIGVALAVIVEQKVFAKLIKFW